MGKKTLTGIVVALVVGLVAGMALGLNKNLFSKDMGAEYIGAFELKQELQKKNAKVFLAEAVNTAERRTAGRVISMRLRRLKYDQMGYAFMVLKDNPVSYQFVIVHATTGEVVFSQPSEGAYQIVAPASERIAVDRKFEKKQ